MQLSQHGDQSSDTTLTKLLEADAELAAQEADLSTQLQLIQEKRTSLRTVIDMFSQAAPAKAVAAPTETIDTNSNGKLESAQEQETPELDDPEPAPTATVDTNGQRKPSAKNRATAELDDSEVTPTDAVTPAVDNRNQKAQKTSTTATGKRNAKPGRSMKTTRKTEGWQQYLREEFSSMALSDAVSVVLQQQRQEVLDIPAVVNAIFVEEIPAAVQNKARDRVSNILSEGVRKNKWYRSQAGSYSMSPVAT